MTLTALVNVIFGRKQAAKLFSKFTSIEPDKQTRILNAALKVFAQRGFEQASTNAIVQEARISKGLLFHYFNNKKDLYLYLYDYAMDVIVHEFYDKIDTTERDILLRLRQWALLKIDIIKKHPELFHFILKAVVDSSGEVRPDLDRRNQDIVTDGHAKLFNDMDTSNIKEGIDVSKVINMIVWTLEGFSAREQRQAGSQTFDDVYFEKILAEMDAYLDLFKKCFYREI